MSDTPSPRDYPEDAIADPNNGAYGHTCFECNHPFVGHKQRLDQCKTCSDALDTKIKQSNERITKAGLDPKDWTLMPKPRWRKMAIEMSRWYCDLQEERALRRKLAEALKIADATNSNVAYWGHPGRHRDTSVALVEKAREMDERLKAREEEGKP